MCREKSKGNAATARERAEQRRAEQSERKKQTHEKKTPITKQEKDWHSYWMRLAAVNLGTRFRWINCTGRRWRRKSESRRTRERVCRAFWREQEKSNRGRRTAVRHNHMSAALWSRFKSTLFIKQLILYHLYLWFCDIRAWAFQFLCVLFSACYTSLSVYWYRYAHRARGRRADRGKTC